MRIKVRSASFGLCKHKPCEVELIAQNCDYTLTTHTAAMESNANQQLTKKVTYWVAPLTAIPIGPHTFIKVLSKSFAFPASLLVNTSSQLLRLTELWSGIPLISLDQSAVLGS